MYENAGGYYKIIVKIYVIRPIIICLNVTEKEVL